LPETREQIATWLGQLPHPAILELAANPNGLKIRLYAQEGEAQGAVSAWAAMLRQQTRWRQVASMGQGDPFDSLHILHTTARIPVLAITQGDPFLALGGRLLSQARNGKEAALRIWILGKEESLQERLRALAAYSYGTEGGVGGDTPNPWGLRLTLWRMLLLLGMAIAGVSGGALGAKWIPVTAGVLGVLGGGVLSLAATFGIIDWMQWRSVPKDVLERRTQDTLLRVSFTLRNAQPQSLNLLSGTSEWKVVAGEWPVVQAYAMPLPVGEVTGLIALPEYGESSAVVDQDSLQSIPSPPPSQAILEAPFRIGWSKATKEPVGIDPDGHGLVTGGSRTGKSSFAYAVLRQLLNLGDDAPGIFLADPHLSLADAFLLAVDELPELLRQKAIQRLRIVTTDQPEVVPLNLLAVPEFTWAGNAIVQVGRRIWDDYWGPRMQAALLGLFKLAHTWNKHNADQSMGLLHTVFAAFNVDWRHDVLSYLTPVERMGTLALDALLGQLSQEHGRWDTGWVTEVISPVLSKTMALDLAPWLFAAMHQDKFVDMRQWIQDRSWIVLRLPSGEMGREATRLTAGVIYNVFDAAFRQATTYPILRPVPFYFIIDEAQEIGAGMRLEEMLSGGAKFGARMFILVQSLSMMRRMEGLDPVVQALLANTSTQAFFSPDPEDADIIRAALSLSMRYGPTTLDTPSLHHWLRARIGGEWQPPTVVQIAPLVSTDSERVKRVIREVIAAHPKDYASPDGWQEKVVRALYSVVPEKQRGLLDELLTSKKRAKAPVQNTPQNTGDDHRRLGF
jgi:hypothetical protein